LKGLTIAVISFIQHLLLTLTVGTSKAQIVPNKIRDKTLLGLAFLKINLPHYCAIKVF
jgi:hypothetical protein